MESRPAPTALSLSGGGFRATLFHLGVVEFLACRGHLRHVRLISAVSGGAILALHLERHWSEFAAPRDETTPWAFARAASRVARLANRGIRDEVVGRALLAWVLGKIPLLRRLARDSGEFSTDSHRLSQLARCLAASLSTGDSATTSTHAVGASAPEKSTHARTPEVLYLTTDLQDSSGIAISTRRILQRITDPPISIEAPFDLPTAGAFAGVDAPVQLPPAELAAALSSAFPLLFPAVRVRGSSQAGANALLGRYLTDGGVFDNTGASVVRAIAEVVHRNGPAPKGIGSEFSWLSDASILVSDAGAPLGGIAADTDRKGVAMAVYRSIKLFEHRSSSLMRRSILHSEQIRERRPSYDWVSIGPLVRGSSESTGGEPLASRLQWIRTDLNPFGQHECNLLVAHGYRQTQLLLEGEGAPREVPPWIPFDGRAQREIVDAAFLSNAAHPRPILAERRARKVIDAAGARPSLGDGLRVLRSWQGLASLLLAGVAFVVSPAALALVMLSLVLNPDWTRRPSAESAGTGRYRLSVEIPAGTSRHFLSSLDSGSQSQLVQQGLNAEGAPVDEDRKSILSVELARTFPADERSLAENHRGRVLDQWPAIAQSNFAGPAARQLLSEFPGNTDAERRYRLQRAAIFLSIRADPDRQIAGLDPQVLRWAAGIGSFAPWETYTSLAILEEGRCCASVEISAGSTSAVDPQPLSDCARDALGLGTEIGNFESSGVGMNPVTLAATLRVRRGGLSADGPRVELVLSISHRVSGANLMFLRGTLQLIRSTGEDRRPVLTGDVVIPVHGWSGLRGERVYLCPIQGMQFPAPVLSVSMQRLD